MAKGRCAGCGWEHSSNQRVVAHTTECPEYLALFREHPERCLAPAEEARRWRAWLRSSEGQLEREMQVEARNMGHKAAGDHKTEAHIARWSPERVQEYAERHAVVTPLPVPDGGRIAELGTEANDPASKVVVERCSTA